MNELEASFCNFPQRRFLHEVRDHLLKLPGVNVTDYTDDPVIGSWVDFSFREHPFTVNAKTGEFIFFVAGTGCPDPVLVEIAAHCQPFFESGGDIAQRRV
jgi:hypothetical protein